MGWDKLSDFQKNEISLYNVLILRKMRLDVENLLNDKYGRKKRAIGANLIPLEILKDYCLNNNITMKKEYEKAYKESDLPMGAPADIRQSYGTSWAEFLVEDFGLIYGLGKRLENMFEVEVLKVKRSLLKLSLPKQTQK